MTIFVMMSNPLALLLTTMWALFRVPSIFVPMTKKFRETPFHIRVYKIAKSCMIFWIVISFIVYKVST